MFRLLPTILGLMLLISSSLGYARGEIIIDTLIVYSPQAESYRGKETLFNKIETQINAANGAFRKSNLNIKIRRVGKPIKVNIQYGKTAKTLKNSAKNNQIIQEKRRKNADIALIFTTDSDHGGAATIPLRYDKDTNTNAVINIENVTRYSTAHEIGHLLRLGHSKRHTNSRKYRYDSYGYGIDGNFVTIMAYRKRYKNATKIGVFSSPNIRDCDRQACGITGYADAVHTIKITAPKLANISNSSTSITGSVAKRKAQTKYNSARKAYLKARSEFYRAYYDYRKNGLAIQNIEVSGLSTQGL